VAGAPGRLVEPTAAGKPLYENSPFDAHRRERMSDTGHLTVIGIAVAAL